MQPSQPTARLSSGRVSTYECRVSPTLLVQRAHENCRPLRTPPVARLLMNCHIENAVTVQEHMK